MPARLQRPVGIVGTFDVANYGDLLFPEIAAHELGRRLGRVALHRYSYRAMASPPWCYPVTSVDRLGGEIGGLALLVVGGGHLVRFDKAVAPGYEPTTDDVHHPTGYWLTPTLLAATAGVPTAWNALGASTDTPGWAAPLLAGAVEAADYVAVRDAASAAELRSVAPGREIRLVPDSAFGIRAALEARGPGWAAGVRDRLGLDGPYVVVQPSTRLGGASAAIADAARALHAVGVRVVELPISPALGDAPGILGFDAGRSVATWPAPMEIAAIVAGAKAVVAHSLHLTITALAHGIPAMRAAAPAGTKYEALTRHAGVRLFATDPGELAELLSGARPGEAGADVLEQVAQLEVHWDRIAELVTADAEPARGARRDAVASLLTRLPAVLEASDHRTQAAAADRDRGLARIAALERELTAVRAESAVQVASSLAEADQRHEAAQRLLRQELAQRDSRLIEANAAATRRNSDLAKATRDLTRTSRELAGLKRRRSVRAALRTAGVARAIIRLPRRAMPGGGSGDRATAAVREGPRRPATKAEERAFLERLTQQLPRTERRDGPLVSIVVPTRNGRRHLERLLPELETTTYRSFELIVVDNASTDGTADYLARAPRTYPLEVVTNDTNRSFSQATNTGAAAASGTLLLLLNNDTSPVTPDWLGRLVTTLEEREAAAVGARLIYPRRQDLDNQGDRVFPDLTLQHRGIAFVPADGVPTGRNLGTGDDPLSPEASDTREVAGLTAACLLIERRAWDAVGGLTEGYVYGSEDVDLALKLRANGERLVYDGGAALWHHEYGTQNAEGGEWKRENRRANRQLFVDRWGPQLFRTVMSDRLRGDRRWSEQPFHVGITVTRNDTSAGWGDLYTARELGEACEALGWRVSYLERYRDRWYEPDPSLDAVVALLDAFDIRRLPERVVTVAWVRNWTHRWLSQPWFDDFDIVFASSDTSRRLIDTRSAQRAQLMPLATNPARFARTAPVPQLAADVVFVGNHWGEHRGVLDTLTQLGSRATVKVFGRGWDETPLAVHDQGPIPYERLPEVYSSARIVMDDTAGPTKPYGAVNARVFDALATGAVVVSDNEEGIRELFDEEFPVAHDGAELAETVEGLLGDPDRSARLASTYREMVLARHTYAHRAAQLRDALLAWVQADRVSILIGAPDRDLAPSWGDYHFARAVQRHLVARGLPTRLEVLPDWERAPAARQDIVIHLFGLTWYRPRPAQVNLLWVISHPDLVLRDACERYDHVFVASDTFAATLGAGVRVPVTPLHQATDPARFFPDPVGPPHELLYVANSRNTRRRIVADLGAPDAELAVYGRGWTPDLIDPAFVKGEYIPNEVLHRYYASAQIVLNDQWEEMRANGFIANRLYDALASGAFVISDDIPGLDAEFDGGVVAYRSAAELHQLIRRYLDDAAERRRVAERGHAAVLARHTFAHRVAAMLGTIEGLRQRHPRDLTDLALANDWLGRRTRPAPREPVATGHV